MNVLQKLAILIKNLYLSKQYGARRLLSELPDKGRKLGSIDSLLKRICKTGTIVRLPGSGRPRSARSSGELCTSSSRMHVIYHNWSATKQRPHPQSVAEISRHSVLSGDRIRQ